MTKIVIADFKDSLMPTHKLERAILTAGLPGAEVVVYEYDPGKQAEFSRVLHDATALLTGFIPVDAQLLAAAPNLRLVSVNATGYDNVNLSAARARQVKVYCVGEYCTEDVAEFTIAQMLTLVKNIRPYIHTVESQQEWAYDYLACNPRLSEMTLGICLITNYVSLIFKQVTLINTFDRPVKDVLSF